VADANQEQVLSWFEDDELRVCPRCGNRKLLPSDAFADQRAYCLDCGVVEEPGG
jgi:ribosomal protein S27AE